MTKVVLEPIADADLLAALEYYESQAAQLSSRFMKDFIAVRDGLARRPSLAMLTAMMSNGAVEEISLQSLLLLRSDARYSRCGRCS